MNEQNEVNKHYEGKNLLTTLKNLLNERGLTEGPIPFEKLAALDQFHIGGVQATAELARLCAIDQSTRIIDIGSGLGGPSRYLAKMFGSHVTGIDQSLNYVEAAKYLAARDGLEQSLDYQVADALNLAAFKKNFDLAWMQHLTFSVPDVNALFNQVNKTLKPDGFLAMFEIVNKENGVINFPVPWARDESINFVRTESELLQALHQNNFSVVVNSDWTASAARWFEEQQKKMSLIEPNSLGPISLKPAVGEDALLMLKNVAQNVREGRLGLKLILAQKK